MQPKDRILDVYGSFGREIGGWLAISDLIELLALVDVDQQAVRSAASRMKRKGLLVSEKRDNQAGYGLSPKANEILEDGNGRIFRKVGTDSDTAWVVALFSVPETERRKRYLIRSRLERLGFGLGPAGSWFAPASVLAETERMLRRTDLVEYVTIWQGDYAGFSDFKGLVAESWDLDEIRSRYDDYLSVFGPLAQSWGEEPRDDTAAFAAYMKQIALWRVLPYLDPGLPTSVMPPDWPGDQARHLFVEFEQVLRPQAMRFFISVIGSRP